MSNTIIDMPMASLLPEACDQAGCVSERILFLFVSAFSFAFLVPAPVLCLRIPTQRARRDC